MASMLNGEFKLFKPDDIAAAGDIIAGVTQQGGCLVGLFSKVCTPQGSPPMLLSCIFSAIQSSRIETKALSRLLRSDLDATAESNVRHFCCLIAQHHQEQIKAVAKQIVENKAEFRFVLEDLFHGLCNGGEHEFVRQLGEKLVSVRNPLLVGAGIIGLAHVNKESECEELISNSCEAALSDFGYLLARDVAKAGQVLQLESPTRMLSFFWDCIGLLNVQAVVENLETLRRLIFAQKREPWISNTLRWLVPRCSAEAIQMGNADVSLSQLVPSDPEAVTGTLTDWCLSQCDPEQVKTVSSVFHFSLNAMSREMVERLLTNWFGAEAIQLNIAAASIAEAKYGRLTRHGERDDRPVLHFGPENGLTDDVRRLIGLRILGFLDSPELALDLYLSCYHGVPKSTIRVRMIEEGLKHLLFDFPDSVGDKIQGDDFSSVHPTWIADIAVSAVKKSKKYFSKLRKVKRTSVASGFLRLQRKIYDQIQEVMGHAYEKAGKDSIVGMAHQVTLLEGKRAILWNSFSPEELHELARHRTLALIEPKRHEIESTFSRSKILVRPLEDFIRTMDWKFARRSDEDPSA
ncbi:MAG: hypothetical protein AAF483_19930 [Planctomycetota bacterium]